MDLHGAHLRRYQDFRDARARVLRVSAVRPRMLHHVCLHAPADLAWTPALDSGIEWPAMAAILEREIKLGFRDADEARQAIMATGATALRGRRLQEDYLLDTTDDALRSRRCVLRVRLECGKSMLTFKGPVQNSPMKL